MFDFESGGIERPNESVIQSMREIAEHEWHILKEDKATPVKPNVVPMT